MSRDIKIIDYRDEHQPFFESFNRAWIEALFTMEPLDEYVLTNPGKAILEPGGAILMAEYKGIIAGTVALRKVDDATYEFTKMAVDEKFRRLGIAEALCYASFKKAKLLGAREIILYSNTLNAAAILMYEKIGFRHVSVEPGVYKRANVKMKIGIDEAMESSRAHDRLLQTQQVKITEAGIAQAALIATIGKKSFRDAFEPLFHSRDELFEYLEFTYNPLKLVKSLKKENNIYLVAYFEGQPAGFAKIKRHSLNELISSPAQMELQKLYVLAEFQGRGVGHRLIQEVINLARKEIRPDHIWLDTHVLNERAILFYEKSGFKKIGNYFFTIGSQTFGYYVMEYSLAHDKTMDPGRNLVADLPVKNFIH
jgi:ribosomal protein S18 acetylase RimI-like enzyme